jgi:excisionase family DNA binding protein
VPESSTSRRYLTLGQAAEYLSVSERSIRTYVSRGDLNASRIKSSRLLRFDVRDVEAMLRPVPSAGGGAS